MNKKDNEIKEEEFYRYFSHCSNCGEFGGTQIPRGIKKKDFFNKNACGRCGCLTLY